MKIKHIPYAKVVRRLQYWFYFPTITKENQDDINAAVDRAANTDVFKTGKGVMWKCAKSR